MIIDNERKNNYNIVIKHLRVNLENIYESEVITWNIEIIYSLVNNLKNNFSLSLIEKKERKKVLVKIHSVQIYEHINYNFWQMHLKKNLNKQKLLLVTGIMQ